MSGLAALLALMVSSSVISGLSALIEGMTGLPALLEDMSGLSILLEGKAGKNPNLNRNY